MKAAVDLTATPEQTWSQWFSKSVVDPQFFRRITDPIPIVYPITPKKLGYWAAYTAAAAGCIALQVKYDVFSIAANYDSYILMSFIYLVDPAVALLNLVTAKYPPANPEPVEPQIEPAPIDDEPAPMEFITLGEPYETTPPEPAIIEDEPYPVEFINLGEPYTAPVISTNDDVQIIIACHNSATRIGPTLISCLQHVRPDQICVVDNGNSNLPTDNTYEVVKSIDPRIHYIWGHIGNKTVSQWAGTLYTKMLGRKLVFTLDDDMRLDSNFRFGAEKISQKCRALFYAIRAIDAEGKKNLLVEWQDLGYKFSDLSKLSQENAGGGTLYPHGAGSLWEADTFEDALKLHDTVFYAEDVKLGMILTQLGYSMGSVAGTTLGTEAPRSLFGATPNKFDQAVTSWEMGRQAIFWKFMKQLFTVKPPSTRPTHFFMFKLAEFYAVYCNVVDWWKLPLFLLLIRSELYWIKIGSFYLASIIPAALWNYIKLPINNRQDLQVKWYVVATFPIFKLIESAMSVLGLFYLLLRYLPNFKPLKTIPEHIAELTKDRGFLEECIDRDQLAWEKMRRKEDVIIEVFEDEVIVEPEGPLGEIERVVINEPQARVANQPLETPKLVSYRTIVKHTFFTQPETERTKVPTPQDEVFEDCELADFYDPMVIDL